MAGWSLLLQMNFASLSVFFGWMLHHFSYLPQFFFCTKVLLLLSCATDRPIPAIKVLERSKKKRYKKGRRGRGRRRRRLENEWCNKYWRRWFIGVFCGSWSYWKIWQSTQNSSLFLFLWISLFSMVSDSWVPFLSLIVWLQYNEILGKGASKTVYGLIFFRLVFFFSCLVSTFSLHNFFPYQYPFWISSKF